MKLFIAEKPSVAKVIAEALPGKPSRTDTHFTVGDDVVTWCLGHLVENAPPEFYNPHWKQWNIEDLPILPSLENWKTIPVDRTKKQLAAIGKLLKKSNCVCVATDADREGQLIGDEVLTYFNYQGQATRILIRDANIAEVKKELAREQPNSNFRNLSMSALARSRADFLYGINMTRLFTRKAREGGYEGLCSVGGVQTPTMGLVVARDEEIKNFKPHPYYSLLAVLDAKGQRFEVKWKPAEDTLPESKDSEGRFTDKDAIAKVQAQVQSVGEMKVTACERKEREARPPLPFNLGELQKQAWQELKMKPDEVMKTAQSLYEKHKAITYPRSSMRYLSEERFTVAPATLKAVAGTCEEFSNWVKQTSTDRMPKCFSDKKLVGEAHFAIIPTNKTLKLDDLSEKERSIYRLVVRQYAIQFMKPHVYDETKITLMCGGQPFAASGKTTKDPGFTRYLNPSEDKASSKKEEAASLPDVNKGEVYPVTHSSIKNHRTTPPKPFNFATLLEAMISVQKYVKNDKIRAILKETDGLGTDATRDAIIKKNIERKYIREKKTHLASGMLGRTMYQILPDSAVHPDIRAYWEIEFQRIAVGEQTFEGYMTKFYRDLEKLVTKCKSEPMEIPHALVKQKRISEKMLRAVDKIERLGGNQLAIPVNVREDFAACRQFIQENESLLKSDAPSEKQVSFARSLYEKLDESRKKDVDIDAITASSKACREFIDSCLSKRKKSSK